MMCVTLLQTNGDLVMLPIFETVFWEQMDAGKKIVVAKCNDELFYLNSSISDIERLCNFQPVKKEKTHRGFSS